MRIARCAFLALMGTLLALAIGVKIAKAQESPNRVSCLIDDSRGISMRCAEEGISPFAQRRSIWIYHSTFRTKKFPAMLYAGAKLNCERSRDGRIDDCIAAD